MKKIQLIFILCFCLNYIYGQNSNDITIGKIHTIDSEILNEKRKIWISIPETKNESEAIFQEKKKYPVLYVLDGDSHFKALVGMIDDLSSANRCPKMIVVGIPNKSYKTRNRDLTPTKTKPNPPYFTKNMADESGGGPNFISFIEKELFPYIEANYSTESYRMFIGHSLGGLTVVNTLIEKPELFDAYVAIDPSMSYDDKKLLNTIKNTKLDNKYINKSLYLAIANTMDEGMDLKDVQKDTSKETEHIRAILELNTRLKDKYQDNFKSKYYEQENHQSVPFIAEYDALRYAFDFYELSFTLQDYARPNIVDMVTNHYKKVSEVFKRDVKPSEEFVNQMGYNFLMVKNFEKAKAFFEMNVTNYPTSFNAYDSLGDFYLESGNKEKAIESFQKSVDLNKDSYSKKKLNKLLKK